MKKTTLAFLILNISLLSFFILVSYENDITKKNSSLDIIKKKQNILYSMFQKTRDSFELLQNLIIKSSKMINNNKKTFAHLSDMFCCWKQKFNTYIETLQEQINHLQNQIHTCQESQNIHAPDYQTLLQQYNNLTQQYLSLSLTYSNLQSMYINQKESTEEYLLQFENMLSNFVNQAQQNNANMEIMFEEALNLSLVNLSNQKDLLNELSEFCSN